MDSNIEVILIFLVVCFIVFVCLIVAGAIAAIIWRKKIQRLIYRYLKPDATTVYQDWERLCRRFPNLNADAIAAIYIKEEASFLAWVGLLTIIPVLGFLVDISYTTLRQMRMLHVITALYKNDRLDPEKLEMQYMGIVGGANLVLRMLLIATGSQVPFFSAIINAAFNWFFTKQIGRAGIGLNKEQSLWQTARQATVEVQGKVLGAKNRVVDTVTHRSRPELALPDAAFQIQPTALEELIIVEQEQEGGTKRQV